MPEDNRGYDDRNCCGNGMFGGLFNGCGCGDNGILFFIIMYIYYRIKKRTKLKTQKENSLREAIIIGELSINGLKTAVAVMDTRFMMASMGYYVGEAVTLLFV